MSKLLYIEASPLESRSHTVAVSQAFLNAYRAAHQRDEIQQLDLWKVTLPPFDCGIPACQARGRDSDGTNPVKSCIDQ